MINREAYDDLCDKLEPYVTQAISLSTEKELADLAAEDKKNKAALNKLLEEEEPDEVTRKSLEYDLLFSLDYTLNSEILRIVRGLKLQLKCSRFRGRNPFAGCIKREERPSCVIVYCLRDLKIPAGTATFTVSALVKDKWKNFFGSLEKNKYLRV